MKILVTTTRMPFTLSVIRKLGRAGHSIYACDTFDDAPGNHSRFDAEHFVTPSPRHETRRYIDTLKQIVADRGIERIVPCMEEVFYMARHLDELSALTRVLASPLEVMARLHDKAQFQAFARQLGLRAPRTITATTRDELRAGVGEFPEYLARPAFSRGGVHLLTNTGPLAGHLSVDDCSPTAENPWLVQEFIHGTDRCSYSIAQRGRVLAHCTYDTPVQLGNSYGVQFLSVDDPEALEAVQAVVASLQYTGQISFDFKRTDDGLYLIECNPRCTNGALLMPGEIMVPALLDEYQGDPMVVPPGERAQVDYGIAHAMFDGAVSVPRALHDFLTVKDAFIDRHDLLPVLYMFLSFRRYKDLAQKEHIAILEAMLSDVSWDGAPIV